MIQKIRKYLSFTELSFYSVKCVDKMSNLMANKLELHGFYRRIDDVDMDKLLAVFVIIVKKMDEVI